MFDGIGLSGDEYHAYLSLLEQPGQTRADLCATLPGWSATKVARTIEVLVTKGLATRLVGWPAKFTPTPPDVALESLTSQQMERVRKVQELIPELMDRFWQSRQQPPMEFVEILSEDRESNDRRARQLLASATSRVRGFERPPHKWAPHTLNPEGLGDLLEADASVERAALARGVRYQVLYDQVEIDDPARWDDLSASIAAGEEARVLAGLPLKLVLFDDWAATTPLVSAAGEYAGLIVVHKSSLLDALSALFDLYWERAVPLRVGYADALNTSADEQPALHDDDRLIPMLAAGLTDTSIARTLGLSRSTVQRRVNKLMDNYGARTRLQLGLQLGRHYPVSGSPRDPRRSATAPR